VPGAEQYKAQQFIGVIPGTAGIITTIAKRVGCSWHTAKKYIEKYATVRQVYESECDSMLDTAELEAHKLIKKGDGPMIRWYLSTKGKHRGYVERVEQEQIGEVVIRVVREKARVVLPTENTAFQATGSGGQQSQTQNSPGGQA